jgi:hypothetical protein
MYSVFGSLNAFSVLFWSIRVYFAARHTNSISTAVILVLSFAVFLPHAFPYKSVGKFRIL